MGFPCVAIKMPKPIAITDLLMKLLVPVKFVVMMALSHLGLFDQPYSLERSNNNVGAGDRPSPSLVPLLVHIISESIKKKLPVVELYTYLRSRLGAQVDGDTVCAVCLNCLERRHEIRELPNCSHVFHRECLDSWVDQDQVSCPLCRSELLGSQGEETKDPWMVERIAYLFCVDYVMDPS